MGTLLFFFKEASLKKIKNWFQLSFQVKMKQRLKAVAFFLAKLFIPLHVAKNQTWQPLPFSIQRPQTRHGCQ